MFVFLHLVNNSKNKRRSLNENEKKMRRTRVIGASKPDERRTRKLVRRTCIVSASRVRHESDADTAQEMERPYNPDHRRGKTL